MAKGSRKRHKPEPELRLKPGHYAGPKSGYMLRPDGSYELAPCDRESFDTLVNEIQATHDLINHVVDHANTRLTLLEARKVSWFRSITHNVCRPDDIGRARYDRNTNRLSFTPKEDPPQK